MGVSGGKGRRQLEFPCQFWLSCGLVTALVIKERRFDLTLVRLLFTCVYVRVCVCLLVIALY